MDGAPTIPSTLTSEFDNMHILDKEKDPSHESNCSSHSDRVGEDFAKFHDPNNFDIWNKMWEEEWEKIKDQFMNDAQFREAYLARAREEDAKWASHNDEMIKLYYGGSSDDSDLDGSDMDDE